MAYSIHGYISYILEANSKRPNDFSLIGMKPNEILRFKWKKTSGIKIQTEIRFKIHTEGEWNNKIIEGSKNRRGLIRVC